MTTDITELAQSLKAAAKKLKKIGIIHNYSKSVAAQIDFEKYATPDNVIALVEALEKAQRANAAQDDHINQQQDRIEALEKKNAELGKYAGKLETINAAAEKLVRCKGRYHSEQNYRALAALFGVTTPDLPPLEHENVHYADAAEMEIAALRQRIAELENYAEAEAVGADKAAEDGLYWMKRCKELESRTVKIPDDVLDALQKVARIRLDMNDFDGDRRGIADCLCDAEEALIEMVNRRAAMLAAAPHDTPALNSVQSVVTVPGKWIPVSERIPEDRKQVILWDAEIGEVTSGHYSHKTQTFYHCGDAIENEITHWMPPPCAPQEVK